VDKYIRKIRGSILRNGKMGFLRSGRKVRCGSCMGSSIIVKGLGVKVGCSRKIFGKEI
jgi:hypothetical protein